MGKDSKTELTQEELKKVAGGSSEMQYCKCKICGKRSALPVGRLMCPVCGGPLEKSN